MTKFKMSKSLKKACFSRRMSSSFRKSDRESKTLSATRKKKKSKYVKIR